MTTTANSFGQWRTGSFGEGFGGSGALGNNSTKVNIGWNGYGYKGVYAQKTYLPVGSPYWTFNTPTTVSWLGFTGVYQQPYNIITIGEATSPSNSTVAPSDAALKANAFTLLHNGSGSITATDCKVSLGAGASTGISLVEIRNAAGSVIYGSVSNPSSDLVSITLSTNTLSVTTSSVEYGVWITPKTHANMPAVPGGTYVCTALVIEVNASNFGSSQQDYSYATLTIDNYSPGGSGGFDEGELAAEQGAPPTLRRYTWIIWDPILERVVVGPGGAGSGNYYSQVSGWTLAGGWTTLSSFPYAPESSSAVWDTQNNRILAFGGEVSGATYRNDLVAFSSGSWSTITANGAGGSPSQRTGHSMVWDSVNNRVLVFGGFDGTYRNDLWKWTSSGGWVQLIADGAGGSPNRRYEHQSAWDDVGQKLYVTGGRDDVLAATVNDVWSWTDAGGWVQELTNDSGRAPPGRRVASHCWDKALGRFIVHGGDGGGGANAGMYAYTTALGWETIWGEFAYPSGWIPRRWAGGAWDGTNNRFIIGFGQTFTGSTRNLNDLFWFAGLGALSGSSVTAGSSSATVAYTVGADADVAGSLVLYSTSTITDVPVEGSTYSVGNSIGSSTVGYVRTVSANTGYNDVVTGLSEVPYYFKIFVRDASGNWSSGNVATGSPVTPTAATGTFSPAQGSISITGLAPAAFTATSLSVGSGSIATSGLTPVALRNSIVSPGVGSISASGHTPVGVRGSITAPGQGAISNSGQLPVGLRGTILSPATATITVTGQTPVAVRESIVTPGTGAITTTGMQLIALRGEIKTPASGAATITGPPPTALANSSSSPSSGELTLTGLEPTVGVSTPNVIVEVPCGEIVTDGSPITIGASSYGVTSTSLSVGNTGVTTGNSNSTFVVGVAFASAGSFSSLTDNKGNTYTQIGSETLSGGGTIKGRMYICTNGVGGIGHVATLTTTDSLKNTLFFTELIGKSLVLDAISSSPDSSSPFETSVTTTQSNDVLVGFIAGDSTSANATHSESNGFSIQQQSLDGSTYWTGAIATKQARPAGSYTLSYTETGASTALVFLAAFKTSNGASGSGGIVSNIVAPAQGIITNSGVAPSLIRGSVAAPSQGLIINSGVAPSLLRGEVKAPGSGAINGIGQVPIALRGSILVLGTGAITFAGQQPSNVIATFIFPGVGQITITGVSPSANEGAVTLIYPTADVVTAGWTAVPTEPFYECINEVVPDLDDYIYSPPLSAVAETISLECDSFPAGTHYIHVIAKCSSGPGVLTVKALNSVDDVVGTTVGQSLSSTPNQYTLQIVTTETTVALRLEVTT